MLGAHNLGHNRKTRRLLCLEQQLQSLCLQTLEIIGGSARLERAAAEHGCARRLDALRDKDNLLLALHRAGARNQAEVSVADLDLRRHLNHRVVRMELAVCLLEGLRDPLHSLDNVKALHLILINAGGVTDHADNILIITLRDVGLQTLSLNPVYQIVYFFRLGLAVDDDNHTLSPLFQCLVQRVTRTKKDIRGEVFSPRTSRKRPFRIQIRNLIRSKKHSYFQTVKP